MRRKVTSWTPTRKWFATLFAGLFLIAGHAFASGGWDATEWGELMTLLGPLSVAYWVPEDNTPAVATMEGRGSRGV